MARKLNISRKRMQQILKISLSKLKVTIVLQDLLLKTPLFGRSNSCIGQDYDMGRHDDQWSPFVHIHLPRLLNKDKILIFWNTVLKSEACKYFDLRSLAFRHDSGLSYFACFNQEWLKITIWCRQFINFPNVVFLIEEVTMDLHAMLRVCNRQLGLQSPANCPLI